MTAPIWATSLAGPSRAKPVQAGCRRVEQRRRNSERGQGTCGDVSVADILDKLRFQHTLGEFLDE